MKDENEIEIEIELELELEIITTINMSLSRSITLGRLSMTTYQYKMKRYFTIFTLLLVTEIAIAVFHFHNFVRYYLGDALVIPRLYCFVQSIKRFNPIKVSVGVLLFAFTVETMQYFSIADFLNIQNHYLRVIIGTHFSTWDLLAYTLGLLPIIFIEKLISHGKD